MLEQEQPFDELTDFEKSLASLTPFPCDVNRDRLMYLAGRASAAYSASAPRVRMSSGWGWPAATAAMGAIALWLGILRLLDSAPHIAQPAVNPSSLVETAPRAKDANGISGQPTVMDREVARGVARFDGAMARQEKIARQEGAALTYLQIRDIALTEGVDALPRPAAFGGDYAREPKTVQQLLQEMLPSRPTPSRGADRRGIRDAWPFWPHVGETS